MEERATIYGVPGTLSAEASFTTDDGERIEIPLEFTHVHGEPLLRLDLTPTTLASLQGPRHARPCCASFQGQAHWDNCPLYKYTDNTGRLRMAP